MMADANNNVSVRELYDYPGKTKSKVWEFFGFKKLKEGPPTKENLDMTKATCRVCGKTYANKGNTTNFKHHVEQEHGGVFPSKNKTLNQPRLETLIRPTSSALLGKVKHQEIDDALSKLLVGKALPISIVDNQYFKQFVALLEPRYKLPSRPTAIQRLQKKKENIEEKLKKALASSSAVGITHDGWTSINTESYFTTTVHFIDGEWELQSAVLGTIKMEVSHTSENIATELRKTHEKWKLPELIATSDNAANEQKAFQLLGWTRFGCYGHRINLIVKYALTINEVSKTLGKARKLVTFFHQSSSITEMLYEKQKMLLDAKLHGHKVIIDVPTRWNSTLFMLQRLLEQAPALMALANDPSLSKTASSTLKNCVFSFEELSLVESLVELLSPFEKATTIVCADKIPTMHKVLPIIAKLEKVVVQKEDDPAVIKKIKEKMHVELGKRLISEKVSLIACILNPYAKDMKFASEDVRESAISLLKEMICDVNLSPCTMKIEKNDTDTLQVTTSSASVNPTLPMLPIDLDQTQEKQDGSPPAKKMKSTDMDEWLEDIVCTGEEKGPSLDEKRIAILEVERYINSGPGSSDASLTLLEWWKKNEVFFPRLAKLAKKFLCPPASSVSSERVFSLAGEIVNRKRSRLHHSNVDMLIFLNKNIKFW